MLAWALQMSEGQTPCGCPVKIKAKEEEVQEALGQMCVICAQVTGKKLDAKEGNKKIQQDKAIGFNFSL